MEIYMTHPEHGTHIAYSDREVAECAKSGWRRQVDVPVAKPVAATVAIEPDTTKPDEPTAVAGASTITLSASSDACPKCGKIVKQGRYIHEKYCSGVRK